MADPHDGADVFTCRDSTIAPLLDVRRRLKAVLDVLVGMLRAVVFLSGSVERTSLWARILGVGPVGPVTQADLHSVVGIGIGELRNFIVGG